MQDGWGRGVIDLTAESRTLSRDDAHPITLQLVLSSSVLGCSSDSLLRWRRLIAHDFMGLCAKGKGPRSLCFRLSFQCKMYKE